MLAFFLHDFSPFIMRFGNGFGLRWYGLAYVMAFLAGYKLYERLARRGFTDMHPALVSDFITWAAVFGVMIGGRVGWILFYGLKEPHEGDPWYWPFEVWKGGMASHGGILGLVLFTLWFARAHKISWTSIGDSLVTVAPVGLFIVRCANFINGELWGKPTDLPWAFGVPDAQGVLIARHPSQLYEASLEGLLLFAILWWFTSSPRPRLAPTGLFLFIYGCGRFVVEWVRLPDANIGYLAGNWLTMGMLLTTPMILVGAGMMIYAYRRNAPSGNLAAVKA